MNLSMIVLCWDKVQQKKSNLKVASVSCSLAVLIQSHQWIPVTMAFRKGKYNIYTALTYIILVEYDTVGNCIHFTYKQSKTTINLLVYCNNLQSSYTNFKFEGAMVNI